jgi:antitoxin component YwqK of YwqJK toxin-antitoxin module
MGMAFMVLQAPLRNNSIAYLLVAMSLLAACAPGKKISLLVASNDAGISLRNGVVHYNGKFFSGRMYQLFPSGDTAVVSQYIKGMLQGWEYKWYANGKLAEERYYINGKKEGVHKGWREDCTKRFEYHFKNDEHEGILKEWFADGTVARIFNYRKGYEEGQQQMWWSDGRIRANYFVKHGERFGLLGQKLCKNTIQ